MRALKICLWISGIVCLLSVFGLFLPMDWLESMMKLFGDQTLPDSPLCVYTIRLMSATYAAVGVFYIILALRPMDYGVLVPFSGIAALFIGVVCGITGLMVSIPILWFMGDSISCMIFGILILIFWEQAKRKATS